MTSRSRLVMILGPPWVYGFLVLFRNVHLCVQSIAVFLACFATSERSRSVGQILSIGLSLRRNLNPTTEKIRSWKPKILISYKMKDNSSEFGGSVVTLPYIVRRYVAFHFRTLLLCFSPSSPKESSQQNLIDLPNIQPVIITSKNCNPSSRPS